MNMNDFEASLRNKIEQRLITMNSNQQIDFLLDMVVNTTIEAVKRMVKVEAAASIAKECAEAAIEAKDVVSYSYDTMLHQLHDVMVSCYDSNTLPEELVPYMQRTAAIYNQPQTVN
jgi:hypothetical protein